MKYPKIYKLIECKDTKFLTGRKAKNYIEKNMKRVSHFSNVVVANTESFNKDGSSNKDKFLIILNEA